MAFIEFDSKYAPVGFLIVPDGGHYKDDDTLLIGTDWDYPGVAGSIGWQPCHDCTDGTVDCRICGKSASDLISDAYDYLEAHEGESFPALDEYLQGDCR